MQTTLNSAVGSYLRAKTLSRATCNEYSSTVRKWDLWGRGVSIGELRRKDVREFVDWVYERAVADQGDNPGRTANRAREHLKASFPGPGNRSLSTRLPGSRFRGPSVTSLAGTT